MNAVCALSEAAEKLAGAGLQGKERLRVEASVCAAVYALASGRVGESSLAALRSGAAMDVLASASFGTAKSMNTRYQTTVYHWFGLKRHYGEDDWPSGDCDLLAMHCMNRTRVFVKRGLVAGLEDLIPDVAGFDFACGAYFARPDSKSNVKFPFAYMPATRGMPEIAQLPIGNDVAVRDLPFRLFADLCRDLMHVVEVLCPRMWEVLFECRLEELSTRTTFSSRLARTRDPDDPKRTVPARADMAFGYVMHCVRRLAASEDCWDFTGELTYYLVSFALNYVSGGLPSLQAYHLLGGDQTGISIYQMIRLRSDATVKYLVRAIVRYLDDDVPRSIPARIVASGLQELTPAPREAQDSDEETDSDADYDAEFELWD